MVFNYGAFGGAAKRYTHLFTYLNRKYPGKFFYIINNHLYQQVRNVFNDIDTSNIKVIDTISAGDSSLTDESSSPKFYPGAAPDPIELDKSASYPRKLYWYFKNRYRQKKIFRQIERLRTELGIKVFIGVFGGIIPLTFYMNELPRRADIIFSNMDSWFTDVLDDMKKLWYRKYYSFNYALENAGAVDFLSPYILNGVRKRGLKIEDKRVFIAPCSFIDYSKCSIGSKENIEISFASRLEPDKNPMMYLEAAKIILAEFPHVKFHLLGEGSLVYDIENYITVSRLKESVNFCFHKNPPEIFANTSVFVSLQSHTNYPSQSVLEAMACGNAIIASGTGDTHLFINEKNGILIKPDTGELVKALRTMIENKELARRLGDYAYGYARQNHTIEKYTEYYLELINFVS